MGGHVGVIAGARPAVASVDLRAEAFVGETVFQMLCSSLGSKYFGNKLGPGVFNWTILVVLICSDELILPTLRICPFCELVAGEAALIVKD